MIRTYIGFYGHHGRMMVAAVNRPEAFRCMEPHIHVGITFWNRVTSRTFAADEIALANIKPGVVWRMSYNGKWRKA